MDFLLKYKNKQRKTSIGYLSNGGFAKVYLLYVNTENRLNNSQLKFGRRIEDVHIQDKPQVLFTNYNMTAVCALPNGIPVS